MGDGYKDAAGNWISGTPHNELLRLARDRARRKEKPMVMDTVDPVDLYELDDGLRQDLMAIVMANRHRTPTQTELQTVGLGITRLDNLARSVNELWKDPGDRSLDQLYTDLARMLDDMTLIQNAIAGVAQRQWWGERRGR